MTKYQHRFANVGFGSLEFSPQEIGILCLLLLRGPQTPGELRSRSNRLCQFDDVNETEVVLQGLIERRDGPFVVRLTREPGRREVRYAHLFGDDAELATLAEPESSAVEVGQKTGGLEQLEELVLQMHEQLEDIKARLELLERGPRG